MKYTLSIILIVLSFLSSETWAAPSGQLDPTFGGGGTAGIGFNLGGNQSDQARAMAKLPDGRIYVAGTIAFAAQTTGIGIARRMPNGESDPTFGIQGKVSYLPAGVSSASVYGIALRQDGNITVVGRATLNGEMFSRAMVCSFLPNGDVAPFGVEGEPAGCRMLKLSAMGDSGVGAIVYDDTSNLLMAGFTTVNGTKRGALIKLYPGGAPNDLFGAGGVRIPLNAGQATEFNAISLAPGNTFVAAGSVNNGDLDVDFLVGRFFATSGGLDTNFHAPDGFATTDFFNGRPDRATSLHVMADGQIFAAGTRESAGFIREGVIAKYLASGLPANIFGTQGELRFQICVLCATHINDIVVQSDGKVVFTGVTGDVGDPEDNDFLTVRLKVNGDLDETFGTNGVSRIDALDNENQGYAVELQGSRILVAGYSRTNGMGHDDFAILRLDHGLNNAYLITPVVGANGSVLPSQQQSVAHSDYKTFIVGANAGYAIKSITGTCPGSLVGNQYIVGPVVGNCTFNVSFAADIALTYTAGEHGSIDGQTKQTQIVPYGSNGEPVNAIADEGYHFSQWSDGSFDNPRTDFVVTTPISVSAHFDINMWVITPEAGDNGSLSPSEAQVVAHGAQTIFTIKPNPGFGIGSVSGCKGTVVGNLYVTAPATENCSVVASFVPSNAMYDLSYTAGAGGSIKGFANQFVGAGENGSEVEAVPEPDYIFVKWSDGQANSNRTDTNVVGPISVTAEFAPAGTPIHIVTPKSLGNGALSPPIPQPVAHGTLASFKLLPNPGFGIGAIEGCGQGELVVNTYTTAAVTQDCTVTASFVASNDTYSLQYWAGAGGSLNGNVNQMVISGGSGTSVLAVPLPGRFFVQWSDGVTDNPRIDANVVANVAATAQFAEQGSLLVKPIAGLGGSLSPDTIQVVASGDIVQFDVSLVPGFAISSVSGCDGSLEGKVFTTAPITTNCNVIATFVPSDEIFLLTYKADDNGTLEVDNQQQDIFEQGVVSGGSGPSVTAVADAGHFFVQWSDGSTDNPRQDTSVIGDIAVDAIFAADGQLLVTPEAGVGGTISPDLIQVVDAGAIVEFTVTPDVGFKIVDVSGCQGSLDGKSYTTGPIQADCTVEAVFEPTDETYSLTYAAGQNGSLEGDLQQVVPSGGDGSAIFATAADGYFFLQWSDGSVQNPRTDTGVIADVDVVAQFVPNDSLIVTPVVNGIGGSIDPDTKQVVLPGDAIQFSLLPDPGFAIQSVSGCEGELIGGIYTTGPINVSCTVEASFIASDEMFTLTYTAGPNGLVNGQALVQQDVISGGTGPSVEAQPSAGFFFVQWSDGSIENPRTDSNIVGDISVTAQFALNGGLVVTPVVNGLGGSLDPAVAQVVQPGDVIEFIVIPEPGFVIEQVSGCGGSPDGNVFTTAPVVANCTVEASFTPSNDTFLLTYLAGPNGSIQGNAEQVVVAGGTGDPVTAVAQPGYFFVKWSDFPAWLDAERVDANVIGDITVTATFALDGTPTHIVTATAGIGGGIDPDGEQLAVEGEQLIFTIQPSIGFVIDEVAGCDGSLVDNKYLTAPVIADCEVTATFLPANGQEFSLSYSATPGGQVNDQLVVLATVPAGGDGPEVLAQPLAGNFFVQWSDGVGANPRQDTHVAVDIDVLAQFAPDGTPIHTVTPKSNLGGALSPLLPQKIAQGASVQFTVLPNPGYSLVQIGGTCGGVLIDNVYTTQPVTQDCTVEAEFAPSDEVFTLTYIAGENGLVNGMQTVEQTVLAGDTGPVVEAQPANGFEFVQWTDGVTDNPRQDMNVLGSIEVTAVFAPIGATTFMVTPIVDGTGGGLSPPVAQEIVEGESAQFTIVPDEGFEVEAIAGSCGGTLDGDVYTTDPVLADCTVIASFKAIGPMVDLTYTAGDNGSLSVGNQPMEVFQESIASGASGSEVTAVPDAGYYFDQWSDGSTDNPRTDTDVVADIDVTAQFVVDGSVIITPIAGAGGALSPSEPQTVAIGDMIVFTVQPANGFGIQSVSGCNGMLIDNLYVVSPVETSCSVEAVFTPSDASYMLTYLAGANGLIPANANQLVPSGSDGLSVSAMPANGHFFVQWSDGSTDNPRKDTHVAADIEVTASFAANGTPVYTVTPAFGAGGALSPPVAQKVAEGAFAQFTVMPKPGFEAEVTGCDGMMVGNLYVTGAVTADCTVEATFTASDKVFTLTYLAGAGGDVNGVAAQAVLAGSDGSPVEADPDPGHFFVQWSDGSAKNPRIDTHVVDHIQVTAQFAADGTPVFTVTPEFGPGGVLSPIAAQKVAQNGVAQFKVLPAEGFGILDVSGCAGQLVGDLYTTGPVIGDCIVTASFAPSEELLLLTYTAGDNGILQVGDIQLEVVEDVVLTGGSGPSVTAVPDAGFVFVKWDDGSTDNPRVDTNVIVDVDVVAEFTAVQTPIYTVTPSVDGAGGTLTPDGPQAVAEGEVVQFTATPSQGYALTDITGTCGGQLVEGVFTSDPVLADCTVIATFEVNDRIFADDFEIIEP
jgi:uncharacterized delta-60 repeat protein